MISLLVKAALLLTIIFSSLGGTAILSASALPGSPIYPLKRGLEEVRLYLNDSPADHSALHAAFAQERAKEMAVMAELGRTPSEPHLANFQAHWRQALECAAQLPDSALQTALANARTMADEQETMLAQAGLGARDQIRNHFERATRSLNQVRSAVELGLGDQLAYRWRMQHLPENWPGEGNGPDYSPGKCQGDCDQDGNSYGPDSPEDEHGPYGPGDCQGDCDQDGNSFGPGNPEDEHGPYGPGECQGDCDQDGNSYGPGGPEDEHGPYGPGECQGDCDQEGNNLGPGGPDDEQGSDGPGECQGECEQNSNSNGSGGPDGVSGDNGGADGIGNGGNNEAGGNGPGAGQNGGDGGGNGGSGGSNDSVGNGGGSNKGGGGNKS